MRPYGTVGPDLYFRYFSDFIGIHPAFDHIHEWIGGALVTHLGNYLLVSSHLGEQTRFTDIVRHGLLHVHVFATFHAIFGGGSVNVVRGRDGHRIDILHLVQHFTVICIQLGLWEAGNGVLCGTGKINVAKGDNTFSTVDRGVEDVTFSLTPSTNSRKVELI